MKVTYKTNSSITSKSMTEWYFGKKLVTDTTKMAQQAFANTDGEVDIEVKTFQKGTGFLTVIVTK